MKINSMYFSPTNTTKKVVSALASYISELCSTPAQLNTLDFTLPDSRKEPVSFGQDEFVITGVPVYAGRVPNVLLDYLNSVKGSNTPAAAVVLYGNRNYDDALIELKDILESNSFNVIAAGAFIGQHSFSDILGAGRPDSSDMETVKKFAHKIYSKLKSGVYSNDLKVKGNRPYRPYYVVKDDQGRPLYDFRKITPSTDENCIDCKLCAEICPMGSINYDDVSLVTGICIKCCACIKQCPVESKFFDAVDFIMHRKDLEINFIERKEPEIFI